MRKLRKGERYALMRCRLARTWKRFYSARYNRSRTLCCAAICSILDEVKLTDLFTTLHLPIVYRRAAVCRLLTIFVFSLFSNLVHAQEPRKDSGADGRLEIRPLQVGDTIPEELWNIKFNMHYADGRHHAFKLNELRGKLILIDFWASWCASCIEGFPKMEKIQEQYGEDIAVLLVNSMQSRDTEERVKNLFNRYSSKHGYRLNIPYLLRDSIFERLFPHNTIPHIVWINRDGVLVANSYPSALTSRNIQAVLNHGTAEIHQKALLVEHGEGPVPLVDTTDIFAGSFFTPYKEGYKPHSGKIYTGDDRTIYQILNMSVSRALSIIYHDLVNDLPWSRWIFKAAAGDDWKRTVLLNSGYDQTFCYQAIYEGRVDKEKAKARFREDFEKTFGINVVRKAVEQDVYVVRLNDRIENIKTAGGIRQAIVDGEEEPVIFQNIRLDFLVNHLSVYFDCPLVMDHGHDMRIDISIPSGFYRYPAGAKLDFLRINGLDLHMERRNLEIAYFFRNDNEKGGQL